MFHLLYTQVLGPYSKYWLHCSIATFQECQESCKNRGWVSGTIYQGIELLFKNPVDGYPLNLWRCSIEVEAPPLDILNKLLWGRFMLIISRGFISCQNH